MYKILHLGNIISYCESPTYVKLAANGCYTNAGRSDAECVAVNGTVYPISDVVVIEADMGVMTESFVQQGSELTDMQELVVNQAVEYSLNSLGVYE